MRKILLVLSPEHQKELGYSTRSIEDDLDLVLGTGYDLDKLSNKDKIVIRAKVRDNLQIPEGYIEDYYVEYSKNILHIRQAQIEVL